MRVYIEEIRQLFLAPAEFFNKKVKAKKLKNVAVFYLVVLFVSAVFNLINFFIITLYVNKLQLTLQDFSQVFTGYLATILITFLLSFVLVFLLHSYLRLFKAKGDYLKTYQVFAYSSAPSLLLGWVPVIKVIASLYGFYLIFIGSVILHKLSRRKSAIAYLLLLAVIILYEVLRATIG